MSGAGVRGDDPSVSDASLEQSLRGHYTETPEALRESRARIVAASDATRRSFERELRDGVLQELALLGLKLGLLEQIVAGDPAAWALVGEARDDLGGALDRLRDLAQRIYPPALEDDGLAEALADAVVRAAVPARLEADGVGRHSAQVEATVYFCCVEALQNAATHAGKSARATVRVRERGRSLVFEVTDDGRGYDPAAIEVDADLRAVRDRIVALGGTLRIESKRGGGTRVLGSVPLD
jgi:signal transduction histidine kinase